MRVSKIRLPWLVLVLALSCACSDPPAADDDSDDGGVIAPEDTADADSPTDTPDAPEPDTPDDGDASPDIEPDYTLPPEVTVTVNLDGTPTADIRVILGGYEAEDWHTDEDGKVVIHLPESLPGDGQIVPIATHPEARIRAALLEPGVTEYTIDLTRFDTSDNEDFIFLDPGEPTRRPNTNQCAHCHQTINEAWFESPHRTSAKNPVVQDLYAGTGAGYETQEQCESAGGTWATGLIPGTGRDGDRCYFGAGLLQTLNPDCEDGPCDRAATEHGDCADCHAPGINGTLGGRDLLEAEGHEYEYGVHCAVCHGTESIDMDAPPGVAGRLRILRPSEEAPFSLGGGGFRPLTFGPHHDSPNPRMGSVQRQHYHDGSICAGCHQQDMAVTVAEIDPDRWPDGVLPVHSTFEEHRTGALGESTRCNSCHMPPDPDVRNTADLQRFAAQVGIQGGWWRAPGTVREHSWVGPRQPESNMLQLAAGVRVDARVEADEVVADITVRNASAGHAIPTGEPSRAILLRVEARCGDEVQTATGGHAIPDFGGHLDARPRDGDVTTWSGAQAGDRLRVVAVDGWHDYEGFGAFDERFTAEQKGMPIETVVGEVEITEVAEDGTVTLAAELPAGDRVYLARAHPRMPDLAGAAGFGFARVMVGADGARMVPHYLAADVASDNRLLPQQEWTSTHRFAAGCDTPEVRAELVYRRLPGQLVRQRGWNVEDVLMTGASGGAPAEPVIREDPPATGNVVELEMTAAAYEHDHYLYAYNGQVPGPQIRGQLGDTLRVTLTNDLDTPTTIHWHGYKVPWAMDGVTWMADPVEPGETFVYEFPLVHAGTFWYHPHFDTDRQVDGGLFGMLIVEDPAQPAADEDFVLVLDALDEYDADHAGHEEDDEGASEDHNHGRGAIARDWTVNGQPAPLMLSLDGGTAQRVRVLNVSNVAYAKLTSDQLRRIGSDQGLLPAAEVPEHVLLGPADRADLEWLVGEDGFSLWAQPYSINGGDAIGEAVELVRVTVQNPAPAPAPLAFDWSGLAPTPDPDHTDIVYAFSGSDRQRRWLINGETFPEVTVQEVALGTAPIIELRNVSPTEHPFHLHGVHFEVLSVNGRPPAMRTIEDNWNVRVRDVVRIKVLADNPGDWMAHCHILPHAHSGMMTVLRVQ